MTEKKLEDMTLAELLEKFVWLSIRCNDELNAASRSSDLIFGYIEKEFDRKIEPYKQELERREKIYLTK